LHFSFRLFMFCRHPHDIHSHADDLHVLDELAFCTDCPEP
jgi:hypothetical protein